MGPPNLGRWLGSRQASSADRRNRTTLHLYRRDGFRTDSRQTGAEVLDSQRGRCAMILEAEDSLRGPLRLGNRIPNWGGKDVCLRDLRKRLSVFWSDHTFAAETGAGPQHPRGAKRCRQERDYRCRSICTLDPRRRLHPAGRARLPCRRGRNPRERLRRAPYGPVGGDLAPEAESREHLKATDLEPYFYLAAKPLTEARPTVTTLFVSRETASRSIYRKLLHKRLKKRN